MASERAAIQLEGRRGRRNSIETQWVSRQDEERPRLTIHSQREFTQNNVFGATAFSSYGAFWISIGIILTPGGFDIQGSYGNDHEFYTAFGFYIFVRSPTVIITLHYPFHDHHEAKTSKSKKC